jgi:ribosomal-protein-alanine N-acetyltransferase
MLLPKLKGERINLRRLKKSDASSINENVNCPEIGRFTFIPYPNSLEETYKFIKECHAGLRAKRELNFGMEEIQSRRIIGCIGLARINLNFRHAEVGFWVAKKLWGQGIGKEAVNLILRFGFDQLGLNRIYARVMHPNIASAKLLESIGFVLEGRMREALWRENGWWDFLCYSMLADEYKALKAGK